MGRAKVLQYEGDGQVRIEIDYGAQKKADNLQKLTTRLVELNKRLVEAQEKLDKAKIKENELVVKLQAEIVAYEQTLKTLPPDAKVPEPKKYLELLQLLLQEQKKSLEIKILRDSIKKSISDTNRDIAYWNAFLPLETRDTWAIVPGFPGEFEQITTIEIPDEPATVLVKPVAPSNGDGLLVAKEVMMPWQAYFNAAVLPGVQRYRPMYRKGTLVSINRKANTASVTLDGVTSSAQGLPVNVLSELQDVPFQYVNCNHNAFIEGDRVVVEFRGYDWLDAKIIGFVSHPQFCPSWGDVEIGISVRFRRLTGQNNGYSWDGDRIWCDGAGIIDGAVLGRYVRAPISNEYEVLIKYETPPSGSVNGIINCEAPSERSVTRLTWRVGFTDTYPGSFKYVMPSNESSGDTVLVESEAGNSLVTKFTTYKYGITSKTFDTEIFEDVIDGVPVQTTGNPQSGPIFETQQSLVWEGLPGFYSGGSYDLQPSSVEVQEVSLSLPTISVSYRGRTRGYQLAGVTSYSVYTTYSPLSFLVKSLRFSVVPDEDGWPDG